MKKRYFFFVPLLTILFSTFSFSQVFDNFDTYTAGQLLACQNPTGWSTWGNQPCSADDAEISTTYALSSPNSVKFIQNDDVVKLLGDQSSGTWYLSYNFYIPSGKAGYFNMLSTFVFGGTGAYWAFECYYDIGGTGRFSANHVSTPIAFNYNVAAWNFAEVKINLNSDLAEFRVNNVLVYSWPWTQGSTTGTGPLIIDAVDFFGATANDEMYVDNFWFHTSPVPVELTSFTANAANGNVNLSWSTASETNNKGFEIERSSNGRFIPVGYVNGAGTTSEAQNYFFTDKSVQDGKYTYRLKQVDFDGSYQYSTEVEVEVINHYNYTLGQNFPNPFNPSTVISYSIPEAGFVKLAVFNMLGEEVAVLLNGQKDAGTYEVTFDAKQLPSGTYFYRLESGNTVLAKKMLLTK